MDEQRETASRALQELGAYQWGYMGGRLARTMAESVKSALTGEAMDAVLREFRHSLSVPRDENSEPTRRETESPGQAHYS